MPAVCSFTAIIHRFLPGLYRIPVALFLKLLSQRSVAGSRLPAGNQADRPALRGRLIHSPVWHVPGMGLCLLPAALLVLSFQTPSHAQNAVTPVNVHARIYSTTALELFFTPAAGMRTHIARNEQSLGVFDTRSLFLDGLNPDQRNRFELSAADAQGERVGKSVFLDLFSGDFVPPVEVVWPVDPQRSATATATPQVQADGLALQEVHAKIYSTTALELFFRSPAGLQTSIRHNHTDLGLFDTASLYLADIAPTQHLFELQAARENGERVGEIYQLDVATGDFSPPVETVLPQAKPLRENTPEGSSEPPLTIVLPVEAEPATESISAPETPANDIQPVPEPQSSQPSVQDPPDEQIDSEPESGPQILSGCLASSLLELRECISAGEPRVSLVSDLACSGNDCCRSGSATVSISAQANLVIEGNGFRLLRSTGQRNCSLLEIRNSRSIDLRNIRLDDDTSINACLIGDRCPHMVHVIGAEDVAFQSVAIENSKGYAVYVNRTDGFEFSDGLVAGSGVLGMYIGHGDTPTRNIRITDSVFRDNQTNGLALLGVVGNTGSNVVTGNTFERNHWQGQWRVEPRFGSGFTGGGQVYLAQVDGLRFTGNRIVNGYCSNCFVQRVARSGVTGLELGLPGKSSVANLRVENNTITNHDAWGIGANQNTTLGNNVVLTNNTLINNQIGVFGPGLSADGNRISSLADFSSFESSSGLLERQDWSSACGRADRVCDGNSLFGNCYLQLQPASNSSSCTSAASAFYSAEFPVTSGRVYLHGWARSSGARICIESFDGVAEIDEGRSFQTCQRLTSNNHSSVRGFNGWPTVAATVGSRSARVVVYPDASNRVDLDDLKLSFGQ